MSRSRIFSFVVLALVIALPLSADGPALFKSKCAACHGADGKGETAMGKKLGIRSLASKDVQKQTDAELLAVTKKGKNKMPAYDGKIPEADLKAVVAHIRTLAQK
jgi:mono/diheme cytochrome c family protein